MHTNFLLENLNGRHTRTWEDNITMDVAEIGWEIVDWMHMVQDRDQGPGTGCCELGNEPSGSIKGGEFLD
jgi:hypothetical protein